MRLWIAAFLHSLPLDALRPRWSDEDAAIAVLEQERVAALTPRAARLGIQPGMRRAGACAIAPQTVLLARDPALEGAVLEGAALALLQYTPEITLAPDHTVLMSVGASLAVFGGPRALLRRAAGTLRALDLHARLGMAPTARGAWLLARQDAPARRRRVLRLPALTRRLDALPFALLPEAQARADWLHDIGCHTLADLRRLPRAGLQRRCGPALLQALDAAYGHTPEVHAWLQPAPSFARRLELMERLEHTDAILAVARRLTEQLGGWLAARQLAVNRVALVLEHERGRHACPPTVLDVALAQPAWQPTHLLSLLGEKLGRLTLPSSVVAVALQAPCTVPQPAVSATLFPDPAGSTADRARLLDLLSARLGPENVRQAQPVADHRPEVANRWHGTQEKPAAAAALPAALERPFWLLDPPQALQVSRHRPVYRGSPLTLVRGPERIESGWWDPGLAVRDYFVAEDEAAARYWVYRERDTENARWFLHGLYA